MPAAVPPHRPALDHDRHRHGRPGFVNVTAPGFDQIGALVSGNGPGQSEAVLAAQSPGCGVIAGFYHEGTPVGAWIVPPAKLPELVAILKANG
ncbi:hypothetical protein GT370_04315 [Acidocella sp. MX-AZ03]|uniref:hypothetical protein n=1 Tax=Acidocella sp. MX-AZ03 TaxID=2697363 RepID=UPI0022DD6183|nr:hypothetical protein [Acidocella sp. MX-AZ03]WBO60079.1 hypothetical protein GT370_04315 [Acidocella sp. MX-AZ03]